MMQSSPVAWRGLVRALGGAARRDFKKLTMVEVGPRDGLQNEKTFVPTPIKCELINKLLGCGLKRIEATSFVSPHYVPQMADHRDVLKTVCHIAEADFSVLVPNMKGYEAARECGAAEVAVFTAASEAFCKKNINCSVEGSLARFAPIFEAAAKDGIRVRGYLSCVMGCPYDGEVPLEKVVDLTSRLLSAGCFEVSLGDTIGVGTPGRTEKLMESLQASDIPFGSLAVHFHDTYGQALANILVAISAGISTVDSSIGGLGGCPYAEGASGNVATEDVLYMLKELGIETGINFDKLLDASEFVLKELGCGYYSRAGRALLAKRGTFLK